MSLQTNLQLLQSEPIHDLQQLNLTKYIFIGQNYKKLHLAGAVLEGSAGIWTRDLAHPKRESYP